MGGLKAMVLSSFRDLERSTRRQNILPASSTAHALDRAAKPDLRSFDLPKTRSLAESGRDAIQSAISLIIFAGEWSCRFRMGTLNKWTINCQSDPVPDLWLAGQILTSALECY